MNSPDAVSLKILMALAKKALKGDAQAARAFFELREKLQPEAEKLPVLRIELIE